MGMPSVHFVISNICLSILLWSLILFVPLVLTFQSNYYNIFPRAWYDIEPKNYWYAGVWPSPLGLTLGILAVIIGQIFVLAYFILKRSLWAADNVSVQREGAREYDLAEGLITHLGQPEGFVMLGSYLTGTWMFGLMPASYYSFTGGVNWIHVALQLLCVDFFQYCMHFFEHKASTWIYKNSHKPHHRFTNPRLFDAFNGSPTDTIMMILVPLVVTARVVDANVWSYMAFGSLYANWLTLIHSEYPHAWDPFFRMIGFGTAADHHVHHKLFVSNYGHLFMYWDRLFQTYRNPDTIAAFNEGV